MRGTASSPGRLIASALCCLAATATPAAADRTPLQDNSFLIEEAYNQEAGVVQHISLWSRDWRRPGDWVISFTQEWPAPGQRHQLSYSVPILSQSRREKGLGDVLVNYRFQWLAGERLAVAPRISAVLPTADRRVGNGERARGIQLGLPVSLTVTPRFGAHTNVGATFLDFEGRGEASNETIVNLGQSFVYQITPRLNVLLEAVGSATRDGATEEWATEGYLAPGLRWGHDRPSGLQIVPGIAYAIGLGEARSRDTLLLYLSFEHSFGRQSTP
jgi:hypothetical protein